MPARNKHVTGDRWLSMPELVDYTGMAETTLRAFINGRGEPALIVKRINGRGEIRVKASTVDEWIEARETHVLASEAAS